MKDLLPEALAVREEVDQKLGLPFNALDRTGWLDKLARLVNRALIDERSRPVPMLLFCPACGEQHVDAPQPEKRWTNPPHRSHECQACGHVWRPADVPTTGVAHLETRGTRDGAVTPETRHLQEAVRLADFLLLSIGGDLPENLPADVRDLANEAEEAQSRYKAMRAGRKVRCLCPGCPEMVPVEWSAGVCRACGAEDCEHEEPESTGVPLTPEQQRDIAAALAAGPVVRRPDIEGSEARSFPEPRLPGDRA